MPDDSTFSQSVLDSLVESVRSGNIVHTYLFEGEQGVGKRQTAVEFARALLCSDSVRTPCGMCVNCIQSASGNNPDLNRFRLEDLSSKKSIGVDEIRKIISDVYIRPFQARYKVYIIEDGDALTPEAQNAMLKILEEPPLYTVFIICTTNLGFILPTVQSRSRIIHFYPQSGRDISAYIKQNYPDLKLQAGFISSYAQGILERADELCRDKELLNLRIEACDRLCKLMRGGNEREVFEIAGFFEGLKKSKNTPDRMPVVIEFMLSQLSDMLKIKSGNAALIINSDLAEKLRRAANSCSAQKIFYAQKRLIIAEQMLRRSVNHKAAVLNFVINVWNFTG